MSLLDYPDPVDLGWTFTGSWESVEFFERVVNETLVKLDWYFTTGTVKTSLDHPTQGRTQLFAKRCDPVFTQKCSRIPEPTPESGTKRGQTARIAPGNSVNPGEKSVIVRKR